METQLVNDHLSLVHGIARSLKRQLPQSVDLDDLVAYGNKGLVEAAKRYDKSSNNSFATFSYYRIRGAILDGLREMCPASRRGAAKQLELEFISCDTNEDLLTTESDDKQCNPEAAFIARNAALGVHKALNRLSARDQHVLAHHYFRGKSLSEIGNEWGLSRSRMSRIHSQALTALRSAMT